LPLTTAGDRPIFPRHDRFAWDFATTTRLSSFVLLRRRCRVRAGRFSPKHISSLNLPLGGAVMAGNHFPVIKIAGGARYEIDTEKARLDIGFVHGFLVRSHWAKGIPMAVVERAIAHSRAYGLYRDGRQVGFARVVTDHATFAYLADVFVIEAERGRGLARWLVKTILADPELQGFRRWLLGTRHAHGLYRRCGFGEPPAPFSFLERLDGDVYGAKVSAPAPRAILRTRRKIA